MILLTASAQVNFICYNLIIYRDSDIRDRCGPDASLYLSLERYLIVLLLVVSVLSLAIILPVNYTAASLQCGTYVPLKK